MAVVGADDLLTISHVYKAVCNIAKVGANVDVSMAIAIPQPLYECSTRYINSVK